MITFKKQPQGYDILQQVYQEGHLVIKDKYIGVIVNNIDGWYYACISGGMLEGTELITIKCFMDELEQKLIQEQSEYM